MSSTAPTGRSRWPTSSGGAASCTSTTSCSRRTGRKGCVGCSFLCDHIDGARAHFEEKDISFVAVSRAPLDKLLAYRKRMGWSFGWVSSADNDFNADFKVSFPGAARKDGVFYNFEHMQDPGVDDLPGSTIFAKGDDGAIYRTYSSYGRGGEVYLTAYAVMDMTPKGRDEGPGGNLSHWVQRHDRYGRDGGSGSVEQDIV